MDLSISLGSLLQSFQAQDLSFLPSPSSASLTLPPVKMSSLLRALPASTSLSAASSLVASKRSIHKLRPYPNIDLNKGVSGFLSAAQLKVSSSFSFYLLSRSASSSVASRLLRWPRKGSIVVRDLHHEFPRVRDRLVKHQGAPKVRRKESSTFEIHFSRYLASLLELQPFLGCSKLPCLGVLELELQTSPFSTPLAQHTHFPSSPRRPRPRS